MSTFWSLWIIVLTVTNLVLLLWLLLVNRRREVKGPDTGETKTTGHEYDGIEEYDNPLPRWWFYGFLASFVFTAFYLYAYPGLGNWKGAKWDEYQDSWTSVNELRYDQQQAEELYQQTYGAFGKMPITELANKPDAMRIAQTLFMDNCALCHGADAGGNPGFPSLVDKDWLYGGTPEKILETITHGRKAAMPAWGSLIGEESVANVAEYVLGLSGAEHDKTKAELGQKVFSANCVACHGADGKGNQQMGAPNLTDNIWLYGKKPEEIRYTIRQGRNGVMPAQIENLKADKIHLLAAYVYSLSLE
ncbi:MAG: cytochrome-c oxidase, cbb3-type subunit III [Cellvibrio sp.]|nr:cytochrome-c oxidase, cbb3-type subunit III [Cellvibrio sp.]